MKDLQVSKISADSADSLCTTNSVESWENFVLLADKRLDYFLTEVKTISNQQKQQETGSGQPFPWKITTGMAW